MVDLLYLATAQMGEMRERDMWTPRTIRESSCLVRAVEMSWKRP